jgi:DNA (cytosine-5)-methyltransferase 1
MASADVHNAHWVDKQSRPVFAGEVDAHVTKPRILDLFCGAGGAAMGYHRAGFEVVGVDIAPQPHYPFKFVQHDALKVLANVARDGHALGEYFDAIHASPPCQAYSDLRHRTRGEYPELVSEVRNYLRATGLPYVIENVPGAPSARSS